MPGPPPEIMVNPALESLKASCVASWYTLWSNPVRAEPKKETVFLYRFKKSNPCTNSAIICKIIHGETSLASRWYKFFCGTCVRSFGSISSGELKKFSSIDYVVYKYTNRYSMYGSAARTPRLG